MQLLEPGHLDESNPFTMFMKKKNCSDSEVFGKLTTEIKVFEQYNRGKLPSNLVDADILYFTENLVTPLIIWV